MLVTGAGGVSSSTNSADPGRTLLLKVMVVLRSPSSMFRACWVQSKAVPPWLAGWRQVAEAKRTLRRVKRQALI